MVEKPEYNRVLVKRLRMEEETDISSILSQLSKRPKLEDLKASAV
jgi:hypothetical protein